MKYCLILLLLLACQPFEIHDAGTKGQSAYRLLMLNIAPSSNGQQVVSSSLNLLQVQLQSIDLKAQLRWVFSLPTEKPTWLVIDASGFSWKISLENNKLRTAPSGLKQVDADQHPYLLWDSGTESAFWRDEATRPSVDELNCKRKIELSRFHPYPHGVFGQANEPISLQISPFQKTPFFISAPENHVFETYQPMLVQDCQILLTASSTDQGSKLILYDSNGQELAQSDPIGTGFRWMHQLGAVQFLPELPPEIVAVRTPHIGGTVELYQRENDKLIKSASLSGYSSHVNRSNNLSMALIGDFNGDKSPNILLPNQSRDQLKLLQRNTEGLKEIHAIALGSALTTNLAFSSQHQTLALGTETGQFGVWY